MQINEIIDKIISSVNNNWSNLYKIRYVYLELGKYLSKNTDFFFSVDNKLGDYNLSFDDIKNAYENENELSINVICKSSSIILKMIYDKLGIKSRLVKSLNNIIKYDDGTDTLDINHWFLVVCDGENEYFCTLSSDLPYIQMNMETRHFGINIPYKKVIEGREIQVYDGEEIKHTVIDRDALREIDFNIGYIKNLYKYDKNYKKSDKWHYNYDDAALAMLSDAMIANKLYVNLEVGSTYFYTDLINFKAADGRNVDLISDDNLHLSTEDKLIWKKILCRYVLDRINNIFYYKIYSYPDIDSDSWDYNTWLTNVCKQLQRYLSDNVDKYDESLYINDSFNYQSWYRSLKKHLNKNFTDEIYDNVLEILSKTNILVKFMDEDLIHKHFFVVLNSLTYHFIHRENLFAESMVDGKVSSKYISHKFKKLFKVIFDCGNTIGEFNRMEYSEQVVIIKMILEKMFKELTKNNSAISSFDENYSLIQNRIHMYSIKHKKSGEYAIVFHIIDDGTYVDMYYFYDPKTNDFKLADILDIYSEYYIVSNRFKSRIEQIEDIEEDNKKAKF